MERTEPNVEVKWKVPVYTKPTQVVEVIAKDIEEARQRALVQVEGAKHADDPTPELLRDCPFCGSQSYFKHRPSQGYQAGCSSCKVGTPFFIGAKECADRWNNRK